MNRKSSLLRGVLCAAFLLLSANQALAQANAKPPTQLTYQGFLTDANGVPFGNAAPVNKTVIFRIYDALTGGNLKWSSQQVITVDKGYFSALLGQGSAVGSEPFSADLTTVFAGSTASDRYLELNADGTTIAPRLRFLAAPYALLSKSATELVDPLTGASSLSIAGGNTTVGGSLTSGALTVSSVTASGNISAVNVAASGAVTASGSVTAASFTGNGANVSNLDANKVTTGTLSAAVIPGLDASKITAGTLANNRTTATSANTANAIVARDGSGNLAAGQVTADSFKIKDTPTYMLFNISRFKVGPVSTTTTPLTGVTQTVADGTVGRVGGPPADWWKSTVNWGQVMYSCSFTIPAGEVWDVVYNVNSYWGTDDAGAIVWTLDDNLMDDSPSTTFGRAGGHINFGQTFTFTGPSTHVVRVKAGLHGGSGSDAIYFPYAQHPAHCVIRKYKSH